MGIGCVSYWSLGAWWGPRVLSQALGRPRPGQELGAQTQAGSCVGQARGGWGWGVWLGWAGPSCPGPWQVAAEYEQVRRAMAQPPVRDYVPFAWTTLVIVKAEHFRALAHFHAATALGGPGEGPPGAKCGGGRACRGGRARGGHAGGCEGETVRAGAAALMALCDPSGRGGAPGAGAGLPGAPGRPGAPAPRPGPAAGTRGAQEAG